MTEVKAWLYSDDNSNWIGGIIGPLIIWKYNIPITINPDAPPGQRVREVVDKARDPYVERANAARPDPAHEARVAKPKPKADADGWIPWAGGPCPVAPNTIVEVRFEDGVISTPQPASKFFWSHHMAAIIIVLYRIVDSGEGRSEMIQRYYYILPYCFALSMCNSFMEGMGMLCCLAFGYFREEKDAAHAYNEFSKRVYGDFA